MEGTGGGGEDERRRKERKEERRREEEQRRRKGGKEGRKGREEQGTQVVQSCSNNKWYIYDKEISKTLSLNTYTYDNYRVIRLGYYRLVGNVHTQARP